VIINADEYGFTRHTSRGIVKAHEKGIVTSTTVMINIATATELRLLRKQPRLGVGLHLNITAGKPVSRSRSVKSMIHDRRFRGPDTFDRPRWNSFISRLNVSEVEGEFRAQVALFEKRLGFAPDHLDSHYHIAGHPKIFPYYSKLAEELRIPARLPVWYNRKGELHVVPGLAERLRERCGTTDHGCFRYFCTEDAPEDNFIEALKGVKEGVTEFMFHPGFLNEKDEKTILDSILSAIDLEILTDRTVKQAVRKQKINLVNFETAFA
jgi:predicted glycoside hydrolase/deacetylase ChbG (UPF0249 family)